MKAATGEEVSAEDLGGADLHCRYASFGGGGSSGGEGGVALIYIAGMPLLVVAGVVVVTVGVRVGWWH